MQNVAHCLHFALVSGRRTNQVLDMESNALSTYSGSILNSWVACYSLGETGVPVCRLLFNALPKSGWGLAHVLFTLTPYSSPLGFWNIEPNKRVIINDHEPKLSTYVSLLNSKKIIIQIITVILNSWLSVFRKNNWCIVYKGWVAKVRACTHTCNLRSYVCVRPKKLSQPTLWLFIYNKRIKEGVVERVWRMDVEEK